MEDPKQIVSQGYDRIARKYLENISRMDPSVRLKYLGLLEERLEPGARVLELGCGAGTPMTRYLTRRFKVTGVDLSVRQLALAGQNAPDARLVRADLSQPGFAAGSFDAVAAFYAITHVPRQEHPRVFAEIFRLLRPGGWLVATLGSGDSPDCVEADWLGAPMFFSHYDGETNLKLVGEAGFRIEYTSDENEQEWSQPVCFKWIVAQKRRRNLS
ncbi:MAG: class I SAM-dependent methyltransferase [Chloroflexi bacterium]|nr:class I SAM-dependent methyltransferase [Chloroflexota bacterium]